MSIAEQITRIETNISNAYTKCQEKGAVIPEQKNSENLASTIESITTGGGGDSVFAINNTGSDIVAGQKIWLNKHNLDENTAYEYAGYTNSYSSCAFFNEDNNIVVMTGTTQKPLYTYNPDTKKWSYQYLTNSFSTTKYLKHIKSKVIASHTVAVSTLNKTYNCITDDTLSVPVVGVYVDTNLVIYKDDEDNIKSATINPTTGDIVEDKLIFSIGVNSFLSVFSSGSKYFYNLSSGDYWYYSDNGTGSGQATLIKTGISEIYKNHLKYVTGLEVGEYIITTTNDLLQIYKFNEEMLPIEDTSLQPDLKALINNGKVCIDYNNDTGVLTIGSMTNVYAFKYNKSTKTFENLNLTINLPTESTPTEEPYRFFLSDDMTSAFIVPIRTYNARYKLATTSDDWYADTYPQRNSLTLTGFATGKTDEQGRYEVSTVLGES